MEAKDLINTKEKDEKLLKKAKVTDLVELMKCKNCLSFYQKDGKYYCKEREDIEIKSNDVCSYWTENLNKNKEIKEIYENIIEILKEFIDTKEENYKIIALWIMGTWLHKYFPSYPYLFVNAMKGSGKTRLLKLIKTLAWRGDMLASLSEAVLFRTTGTLCIDEFEGISGKDKNALRELLNTAYKKGGKVKRMRKKKTEEGEQQIVEEFDTYRPIVMANIYGMEEVLGDRCINIVLEKSSDKRITRMIEDFDNYIKIITTLTLITSNLGFIDANDEISVVRCSYVTQKNIYREWNDYIKETTLNYTTTLTTHNNTTTQERDLFDKIYQTEINGRDLELTFPLLLISAELGILDEIIEIVKKIIQDKREEDVMESRDIMVYGLISKQSPNEWYKVKEIVNIFRQEIDFDEKEEYWLNARWMGKALKRLNLIGQKRRTSQGVEVILNIEKAMEKLEMFK